MPNMSTLYMVLWRGINVGGGNLIKMADLKACFAAQGFPRVTTDIQSGNVVFQCAIPQPPADSGRSLPTHSARAGALYFLRLIAQASQSQRVRLVGLPIYQQMTIRNWNTTCKLLALRQTYPSA